MFDVVQSIWSVSASSSTSPTPNTPVLPPNRRFSSCFSCFSRNRAPLPSFSCFASRSGSRTAPPGGRKRSRAPPLPRRTRTTNVHHTCLPTHSDTHGRIPRKGGEKSKGKRFIGTDRGAWRRRKRTKTIATGGKIGPGRSNRTGPRWEFLLAVGTMVQVHGFEGERSMLDRPSFRFHLHPSQFTRGWVANPVPSLSSLVALFFGLHSHAHEPNPTTCIHVSLYHTHGTPQRSTSGRCSAASPCISCRIPLLHLACGVMIPLFLFHRELRPPPASGEYSPHGVDPSPPPSWALSPAQLSSVDWTVARGAVVSLSFHNGNRFEVETVMGSMSVLGPWGRREGGRSTSSTQNRSTRGWNDEDSHVPRLSNAFRSVEGRRRGS